MAYTKARPVALLTDEELVAHLKALSEFSRDLDELRAKLLSEMVRRVMLDPWRYVVSYAMIERKS